MPLYHRQDNGDGRCPVREIGTLSAGVNRYSTVVRSTETSTQNTSVKKKKMCSKKFTQKFAKFLLFLFCGSYFCVLVVGRENRENLDLMKISLYTVYGTTVGGRGFLNTTVPKVQKQSGKTDCACFANYYNI